MRLGPMGRIGGEAAAPVAALVGGDSASPVIGDALAFGVVPLVVLLVETLAAFLFALWAVNRADITGYAMAEES